MKCNVPAILKIWFLYLRFVDSPSYTVPLLKISAVTRRRFFELVWTWFLFLSFQFRLQFKVLWGGATSIPLPARELNGGLFWNSGVCTALTDNQHLGRDSGWPKWTWLDAFFFFFLFNLCSCRPATTSTDSRRREEWCLSPTLQLEWKVGSAHYLSLLPMLWHEGDRRWQSAPLLWSCLHSLAWR